jgi:ADP-dependent NAD(P)H-hydrate dehydratase / NAD(P)H-hydrate epimerase
MKILSSQQQREADQYTILHEPIVSIDLMERAALCCADWLTAHYVQPTEFQLFCGTGNNGGDGLALARLLAQRNYSVTCYIVRFSATSSEDFEMNLTRLKEHSIEYIELTNEAEIVALSFSRGVIIDCLLGTGIARPTSGLLKTLINQLNTLPLDKIAIDVPSGLYCEQPNAKTDSIVKATHTLTFQSPKLNFFFPENAHYVGQVEVLDIGLDQAFIKTLTSPWQTIDREDSIYVLKERTKFSHKGSYGHAVLIAGSAGKMGAAILAGRACLRSGVGLLTYVTPKNGNEILQTSVPEAMTILLSENETLGGDLPQLPESNLGIGPGIGTSEETSAFVEKLLLSCEEPIVIDADALNIIAAHSDLKKYIPKNSILTPHPKEFERLVGAFENSHERLNKQLAFSAEYDCFVLVKGAHTCITSPSGNVYFNTTGNPGMATGGSGDVLTGIITSLLAQSYSPKEATLLGAYIHGLAGDKAATAIGTTAMIASDIIDYLPIAFETLRN